jgi:hypothetical protein
MIRHSPVWRAGLRLWRFAEDESASVTVEFVIMMPLLFWCFLGSYTFFDAYRTQSLNVKAATLIGDQVSRETAVLPNGYVDGLGELLQTLVQSETGTSLRVTAFGYEDTDDSYRVIWSDATVEGMARGPGDPITDVKDHLPLMGENEVHILTETWLDYASPQIVGLGSFTLTEVIVTRSRVGRICWTDDEVVRTNSLLLC